MNRCRRLVRCLIALVILGAANVAPGPESAWGQTPATGLLTLRTLNIRRPGLWDARNIRPAGIDRLPTAEPGGPIKSRLALWTIAMGGAGYLAYEQSQASWGTSNGRFHFKDDLRDGLALSDETSHLFAAYELTRALHTGYRWTGLSPAAARRLAALHAWVWTFLVEYPIDAYNPTQGFGASDLVFNTAGVLAAYQRTRGDGPHWWDIKISVKPSFFEGDSRFIAHSNEQYDDYVYWFTVRPFSRRTIPLWLGAGYSTTHRAHPAIDKELQLAIGTTLPDLAGAISPAAARTLRPLDFFFFNIGGKIVWR